MSTNRIVLILRHFTVGGLERVLLSHARVLLDAGYEVTVCVLDPGRDNALVAELPVAAELVVAPRNRLRRNLFLAALVRDKVVVLEFGDGRLYPAIRPALRRARTVVRFCHSDYSHLRSRGKNLLDRVLSLGEDHIVAVGGRSTRFLLDDVGIPAAKVTTLTNATEPRTGAVTPPSAAWAQDRYVVAVQSLYPHKGHDSLLRAFARALADTTTSARLVIIGDGDQTIALRQLAAKLDIADRVVWLGAVWQRDLVDSVLAGAAGFVSMSRFEGVPISVLEARQHSLPLILTDIPGHRDGAGGRGPAQFVPVDDIVACASHIRELLTATDSDAAAHRPDRDALALEWDTYRDQFLGLIEQAAGTKMPVQVLQGSVSL
ncbi:MULTISPECIES: glycosyltransferase [Nocardia]|uniref:Glycosyltransferase n=1 Tax=Nocardia thailandica TaxID=257275 RepID=A0ABW6PWA5_9NOCA|nr:MULTISPECIES: glycosyltransferase [Nocardia]